MMPDHSKKPVVLTIAGSDSCAGAGIQADLRTFDALDVSGTCAITCITAQNPHAVNGVLPVDPEMVSLQIKTICDAFPVTAVKTGMVCSEEIIRSVAGTLDICGIKCLVVDPVLKAGSGRKLLEDDAINVLCSELLPRAAVITPNLPEAEILADMRIKSVDDMKQACLKISDRFSTACAVKGGHLEEKRGTVVDVLCEQGKVKEFSSPEIEGAILHGSGCIFSAAITAFLALDEPLDESVQKAKDYVADKLLTASRL
jgi:hydroxymethylpyrimidine/phosphomethylpyrimidine kinase